VGWPRRRTYVRRQGHAPEDAQDLTQEFFARFLEKQYVHLADPARGKFRSFLLTALKHFLTNEWVRTRRQKRGGGQPVLAWDQQTAEYRYQREPVDELTPEKIIEKRWAVTLLEQVLAHLREEQVAAGHGPIFEAIKAVLWGEQGLVAYAQLGAQLGLTEAAVKVAVHRLRRRYRELLRAEIARTVGSVGEVDEELRDLMAVLRG
jgi:RNA polymerase sigma-70 factor (ECF subfamily)